MISKSNDKRLIVFDIRLLCDIESIHFDITRKCVNEATKRTLPMRDISILRNQGLDAGTKELLVLNGLADGSDVEVKVKTVAAEVYKYIAIVKPRLLFHILAKQLASHGLNVIAYSHYEEDINKHLEKNIATLYDGIPIAKSSELAETIKTPCTLFTSEDCSKFLPAALLEGIGCSSERRAEGCVLLHGEG
eukprot:TRINITY_DN4897_c0_g3_i10.p2 TRINITY_DN4897_c0_g3~~TRINITY_DN4897_c0_g3_i10.p2  ORF type:complete len:191 (+),score=33.94 TRINITY_DN4897_c0_g3_i10:176-748(+)